MNLFTKTMWVSLGVCLLPSLSAQAQVTFGDSTAQLVNSTLSSGVAMGIADMNGDGLDDIVRLNNASDLEIEYQSATGVWTHLDYGNLGNGSEWSLCVADVDDNGYNDIFSGGFYNDLKVLTANGTGTNYTTNTLPGQQIFLQGSNFADIDNNGTIDIFACHDEGLSSVYNNDGTGTFTYDLSLLNPVTTIPSDNSGNYGTVWTDYDNDGDLDMYLSKCRLGVTDSLDGRRVNILFQNDGNGNYTDVALAAGLRPLAQSWATDFADIDNDGDLDCFILNHDITSQVLINNGNGTFTDITATTGIAFDLTQVGLGIQCKFEDFDNDTYVDLLFTGRSGDYRIYWNNGDLTFTASDDLPSGGVALQSAAVGDLNHDGFIDILGGFANGFNGPSGIADRIFINDGNGNNYYNILLEGTVSNTNAIGARVNIYGPFGMQTREVRAGESYGIFHSFTMHFGLDTFATIDSVVVNFPSGIKNVILNPTINSFDELTETACSSVAADFSSSATNATADFTDLSTATPTAWMWDFGDGQTSTMQNPTHTYTASGTYTVCLVAINSCGADTMCQNISVTAVCNVPTSAFTATTVNLSTLFTDMTAAGAGVTDWLWDFGDGESSTMQNPNHVYDTAGTYNVCLTTTNACGSNMVCQMVTLVCPVPTPAFTDNITDLEVSFTDNSSAATNISSWMWDFGDGQASAMQNPTHTYTASGTYTVCLTITDQCGSNMFCEDITVACAGPTSVYTYNTNADSVIFTDGSTASDSVEYLWNFDDGNTSTDVNPIHHYDTSGTYNVCLTVTDVCGTSTSCQTINVVFTGIEDEALAATAFTVFPNPNQGIFSIERKQAQEVAYVSVLNIVGAEVMARKPIQVGVQQMQFDLSTLPNGVYMLVLEGNNQVKTTHRMIKK